MLTERIKNVFLRYGWQFPFVVLSIFVARSVRIRQRFFLFRLLLTTRGSIGDNVRFGKDVDVNPGAHFHVADDVVIGARCIFELSIDPRASVSIGSHTWISRDCHICGFNEIVIGNHVLVGEFVSIRDFTHAHASTKTYIKDQGDVVGRIVIEDGAWIGRGCLIQGKPEGTVIGRCSIIAANSVVTHSVPPFQIWGGVPARYIRDR